MCNLTLKLTLAKTYFATFRHPALSKSIAIVPLTTGFCEEVVRMVRKTSAGAFLYLLSKAPPSIVPVKVGGASLKWAKENDKNIWGILMKIWVYSFGRTKKQSVKITIISIEVRRGTTGLKQRWNKLTYKHEMCNCVPNQFSERSHQEPSHKHKKNTEEAEWREKIYYNKNLK